MAIDTRFKPLILISFYSILLFYYIYYYIPNKKIKKKWPQIQIAKKKGGEFVVRNHSTLEMIVLVYRVNSLKWKIQIILCGGTIYLAFLPQIVYCFLFPKECWYVAMNIALIHWILYQRVSSPLEQHSLSDLLKVQNVYKIPLNV